MKECPGMWHAATSGALRPKMIPKKVLTKASAVHIPVKLQEGMFGNIDQQGKDQYGVESLLWQKTVSN
jgi:hypothetical protein